MTRHYRWDTTLDDRRRDDPGIDDPARRAAAREARSARDAATTWRRCAGSAASPRPKWPGP
jgi:hypothetical protein